MTPSGSRERATKGERTRRRIVERAAALFNTRGVAGASMSDVSEAAGLEKGGVYNHFESKDALALAAFDYASSLVLDRIDAAIATHEPGYPQLHALIDLYRGVVGEAADRRGLSALEHRDRSRRYESRHADTSAHRDRPLGGHT